MVLFSWVVKTLVYIRRLSQWGKLDCWVTHLGVLQEETRYTYDVLQNSISKRQVFSQLTNNTLPSNIYIQLCSSSMSSSSVLIKYYIYFFTKHFEYSGFPMIESFRHDVPTPLLLLTTIVCLLCFMLVLPMCERGESTKLSSTWIWEVSILNLDQWVADDIFLLILRSH